MKFILGKKIEMTQEFSENGQVFPVTVIKAGPCRVTQVKTQETDGYQAAQIGFAEKRSLTKALLGHLKELPKFRYLKEFRLDPEQKIERGQTIAVNTFEVGEKVKVTGVSKGKGFQGVVKRHGFHGSPASHGHKDQLRMPGSIGATDAARVFKGTRMGGRTGGDQTTVSNIQIYKIDEDNNLIYLVGAVPGARNGLVWLTAPGELAEFKEKEAKQQPDQAETNEEPKENNQEPILEEEKTETKPEAPVEEVKAEENSAKEAEEKKEEVKEESKASETEKKEDDNKESKEEIK